MKNDSEGFLEQLGALPPGSFEHEFASVSRQLGLGVLLDRNEITLLCEAALRANLCTTALNDHSGDDGKIISEQEAKRVRLEWEFMTSRDILYASPGWQALEVSKQNEIERQFLTVAVGEECLAR